MSYSIRHQVFVSSTFTDLVEERAEVIQAIWELDCIPTGMEAFVSSNESQWDVIKRVINECDYYVLIIGGRYGTITADGVSYTEKEYLYAKELGIPVLAFVHGQPDDIAINKSELDEKSRARLDLFRAEIMRSYPVRTWSNASELGGIVSRSLIREIKINPRLGWIRNDGSSPVALLEQINKLTDENRDLRAIAAAAIAEEVDPTLESGDDQIELFGYRLIWSNESSYSGQNQWSVLLTWDDIFRSIGPVLINESTEQVLKDIIAGFNIFDEISNDSTLRRADISLECWNAILVQFRALGLITPGVKKRGVNDRNSYWCITPLGERHLVHLLARRRKAVPNADTAPSAEAR